MHRHKFHFVLTFRHMMKTMHCLKRYTVLIVQSLLHVRLTKPLRNSIFLVKNACKGSFLLPSTCSILQRSFKITPERIAAPLISNASNYFM